MRKIYSKEEVYLDLKKISKDKILYLFEVIKNSSDYLYIDDSINFKKGLYIKNYPKLIFESNKWICTRIKHKDKKELSFNEFLILFI